MATNFFPPQASRFEIRWIHLPVQGKPKGKLAFTPMKIIRTGLSSARVKNAGG